MNTGGFMSTLRKLAGIAALLMAAALGACNLSQSGALQEVALNPPTLQASPTRTPIPFGNPTRTAVAAPTITFLGGDRKSTRLNSSHPSISYAVFCLKKKKKNKDTIH